MDYMREGKRECERPRVGGRRAGLLIARTLTPTLSHMRHSESARGIVHARYVCAAGSCAGLLDSSFLTTDLTPVGASPPFPSMRFHHQLVAPTPRVNFRYDYILQRENVKRERERERENEIGSSRVMLTCLSLCVTIHVTIFLTRAPAETLSLLAYIEVH